MSEPAGLAEKALVIVPTYNERENIIRLIDAVLARVSPERIEDVVVLDPSDEDFPVGFNILAANLK